MSSTEGTREDAAKAAWEGDVQLLRARLREIVHHPEVRQTLFTASQFWESSVETRKRAGPTARKG